MARRRIMHKAQASCLALLSCVALLGGNIRCANFDDAALAASNECPETTFQTFKAEVENTCSSCHSPSGISPTFDTTNYASSVSAIVPGDLETSILYQKVTTGSMRDEPGASAAAGVIRCWILQGGKER